MSWLENIRDTYGVNPYIFGLLYLLGVIPFWFSIYKMAFYLKKEETKKIFRWALVLGASIVTPFIYVAIWGRNLPFWFWLVVGGLIFSSAFSAIRKLRTKREL
ncbi:MAG: hypothetical protein AB1393_01385 [Candidatus Edwardsbacteria bacterium]